MSSLPPEHRGAGSGMNTTFQNSAQVLSIGIFFTLIIVGLSTSLSTHLYQGLTAHGVSASVADRVSHLPPVSTLFAAFLGYNPVQHLVGPEVLSHLDRDPAGGADRSELLPEPDRRAVPGRAPRGPRLRHRGQPVGRRRVMVAGKSQEAPRIGGGCRGRGRDGWLWRTVPMTSRP